MLGHSPGASVRIASSEPTNLPLRRRLKSKQIISSPDSLPLSMTTRGLMIDAGSGGSRLHVYNWQARVFSTVPPPITYPTTDEHWTARMSPGIATLSDKDSVAQHLAPLIDFAKQVLVGLDASFPQIPIYFKATGGMRELPLRERELIMSWVRELLDDDTFCPFYFRFEMARVISGEEEAIFSWAAINFLMGNLLLNSEGIGQARPMNSTLGTLDLGGASCQIAFFVPSQDVMEGMFKLQIGAQKHWNVYTKSFLQFGINSARDRHFTLMADRIVGIESPLLASVNTPTLAPSTLPSFPPPPISPSSSPAPNAGIIDYCLHAGYTESSRTASNGNTVDIPGPDASFHNENQLELCAEQIRPMLGNKVGSLCESVYHSQCSIYGAYQPDLPPNQNFIGTSSYKYAWNLLMLPQTSSIADFRKRAAMVCSLSYPEVVLYSQQTFLGTTDEKLSLLVPYFCFMSAYTLVLLEDGFGFTPNHTLTVLDEVNGNKVGWALGAILYEINTLPYDLEDTEEPWGGYFLAASIGIVIGGIATFFLSKELLTGGETLKHSSSRVFTSSAFNSATGLGFGLERTQTDWSSEITQINQYNPFDRKHKYVEISE